MVQSGQTQGRQVQRALRRGAQAVLVSRGMNPSTRRGSKELDFLLDKLSQKSYASVDDAIRMGEAVGWEIVKLSEKRNQRNLDVSVIRQVASSGDLLSLVTPQAETDSRDFEDLNSNIHVEIDMHRGGSPIEKTPQVKVTGEHTESGPAGSASKPSESAVSASQENVVTSEPVQPKTGDEAATAADIESDPPLTGSVSKAVSAVSPERQPDGAEMDSQAEEEPAAVDADKVEDLHV